MKTLKQYDKKEVQALVKLYNDIVKTPYIIGSKGIIYMLDNEVSTDPELLSPYHEIASYMTKSGNPVIFELDWA